MDKYKFGEFIYQKRKALGFTQDELGRKLGLTNKAVSKWETGETIPEIIVLIELAKILGVSVDELLTQEVKEVEKECVVKVKSSLFLKLVSLFLLCLVTIFGYCLFKPKEPVIVEDVILTDVNYSTYIDIVPIKNITVLENSIIIDLCVDQKDENLIYEDVSVTIVYSVYCYFVDSDGKTYAISYLNYHVETLVSDINNQTTFTLSPKSDEYDFSSILKIESKYEIYEINGRVGFDSEKIS